MEDGSWMKCHWAEQALFAFAIVIFSISILHLIMADAKIKLGLALAVVPTAIVICFIPDALISLCMMKEMRCHTIMQAATYVFAIFLLVISVIDIFICRKSIKK